jgi:hypothetical protein
MRAVRYLKKIALAPRIARAGNRRKKGLKKRTDE